jgi:hypothetical protein
MNKRGCGEIIATILVIMLFIGGIILFSWWVENMGELKDKACKELGYDHYQMHYNPYCVSKDGKDRIEIVDIECNSKKCKLMLK